MVACWSPALARRPKLIIAVLWQASYGKMGAVAKKRKLKRLRAVKVVKAMARERIGTPPAERVVTSGKKKQEKHKPTLQKMLRDFEL